MFRASSFLKTSFKGRLDRSWVNTPTLTLMVPFCQSLLSHTRAGYRGGRCLLQIPVPPSLKRLNGGAARSGGISIGHHMNRNVHLLLALDRHARANLVQEPALEFLAGFECASADNQGIGVEDIHHLVEE